HGVGLSPPFRTVAAGVDRRGLADHQSLRPFPSCGCLPAPARCSPTAGLPWIPRSGARWTVDGGVCVWPRGLVAAPGSSVVEQLALAPGAGGRLLASLGDQVPGWVGTCGDRLAGRALWGRVGGGGGPGDVTPDNSRGTRSGGRLGRL